MSSIKLLLRDSNKSISLRHFRFEEDAMENIAAKRLVPLTDLAGSPADIVEIPGRPFINNWDGHPYEISIAEAASWGIELKTPSTIFFRGFCGANENKRDLCIKFAFNVEKLVDNRMEDDLDDEDDLDKEDDFDVEDAGDGFQAKEALLNDAAFHMQCLSRVGGDIVPQLYGVWRASTDWAGEIICSIFQWGGVPWSQLAGGPHDTLENKLLIAETFAKLHDNNVVHRQLMYKNDVRHILFDIERKKCLIVDFALAGVHKCKRKFPMRLLDAFIDVIGGPGCLELANISLLLDLMPHGPSKQCVPGTVTYDALTFFDKYQQDHPEATHAEVLNAQYLAFYSD